MAKKKEEEEVEEQEELVVNVGDDPEYTIDDLPGVGPATAEKLREAGFDDLMAIAVMNPADLADQAELGEAVSSRIINGARKMASIGGFLSGIDILEKRGLKVIKQTDADFTEDFMKTGARKKHFQDQMFSFAPIAGAGGVAALSIDKNTEDEDAGLGSL